jgi:3-methyladenine DNA glycosylase AlkD
MNDVKVLLQNIKNTSDLSLRVSSLQQIHFIVQEIGIFRASHELIPFLFNLNNFSHSDFQIIFASLSKIDFTKYSFHQINDFISQILIFSQVDSRVIRNYFSDFISSIFIKIDQNLSNQMISKDILPLFNQSSQSVILALLSILSKSFSISNQENTHILFENLKVLSLNTSSLIRLGVIESLISLSKFYQHEDLLQLILQFYDDPSITLRMKLPDFFIHYNNFSKEPFKIRKDCDWQVRYSLFSKFPQIFQSTHDKFNDHILKSLVKASTDSNQFVRQVSVQSLLLLNTTSDKNKLENILANFALDSYFYVTLELIKAFKTVHSLFDPDILTSQILNMLNSKSSFIKAAALELTSLNILNDQTMIKVFNTTLESENFRARLNIVTHLPNYLQKASLVEPLIPIFKSLLIDKVFTVRMAVIDVIPKLTMFDKKFFYNLAEWLASNTNYQIRQTAFYLLKKVNILDNEGKFLVK